MTEGNVYYDYFRNNVNSNQALGQNGGKFYSPAIGHVYASPQFFHRGRGILGPGMALQGSGVVGDIFKTLFRWSQPLLKRLGKKVVDSASGFAKNVARDAFQGENILESVKKHGAVEGRQLLSEVPQEVGEFFAGTAAVPQGPSPAATVGRNAIRASNKRTLSKKKTGKGVKKQRGRGSFYSQLYPALKLMSDFPPLL